MKKVIALILLAFAATAYAADIDVSAIAEAYHNSPAPAWDGVQVASADIPQTDSPFVSPVVVKAGTGADSVVGVDLAAANEVSDGWPWYAKAGLVAGCIAVAGLATWAVVDACDGGRHDNDQSQRIDLHLDGEGNTLTVHFHTDEPHNTTTTGR